MMSDIRFLAFRFAAAILLVAMSIPATGPGAEETAAESGGYVWLDIDGEPLPFQDHATILHVIRTATPVSRELGVPGAADAMRLVLDHRNIRFHVMFRTVDDSTRVPPSGDSRRQTVRYRDTAVFETAAYELSELLGIGRVPPTTERRVVDTFGTVQLWPEDMRSEAELDQRGQLTPPSVERWNQQMQILMVFDNLIANSDRNPGNLMVDNNWNLWFTGHTHAFRQDSRLFFKEQQRQCERRLWAALQQTDEESLRRRLGPYLEDRELNDLLMRREKLIRHIDKLIRKHGEDGVLFDLDPPEGRLSSESG